MRARANQLKPELLEQVVERGCYLDQQDWFWRHDPKLRCESLFRMSSIQVKILSKASSAPFSQLWVNMALIIYELHKHLIRGFVI